MKQSNLEFFIKGALKSTKFTKSDLVRSRNLLNNAILNPCCIDDDVILGIAGPTGTIASGTSSYPVHITSSVTGVADSEVQSIALYINNVFIDIQDGNDFVYDTSMVAENPAVEQVYYTVAVLQSGQTIVSPVLQFTLTNTIPSWSFLFQNQIAQISQTRHIVDRVSDVNLDTITVTAPGLPSFCTMTLIPVTGTPGQSAVVVDITCSPGALDAGTYNFTLRATDGSGTNVDKAVNLLVDANAHQRYTVRPATSQSIAANAPIGTALGTLTATSIMNGVQLDTVPQPVLFSYTTPGNSTVNLVTLSVPTGPGKQIIVGETRNASTGTGGRNEDAFYIIVTVV